MRAHLSGARVRQVAQDCCGLGQAPRKVAAPPLAPAAACCGGGGPRQAAACCRGGASERGSLGGGRWRWGGRGSTGPRPGRAGSCNAGWGRAAVAALPANHRGGQRSGTPAAASCRSCRRILHGLSHPRGGGQGGLEHPLGCVSAGQDVVHRQLPLQGWQLLVRLSQRAATRLQGKAQAPGSSHGVQARGVATSMQPGQKARRGRQAMGACRRADARGCIAGLTAAAAAGPPSRRCLRSRKSLHSSDTTGAGLGFGGPASQHPAGGQVKPRRPQPNAACAAAAPEYWAYAMAQALPGT